MEKRMISSESFESRGWISERYSAYGKTAVSLDDASVRFSRTFTELRGRFAEQPAHRKHDAADDKRGSRGTWLPFHGRHEYRFAICGEFKTNPFREF